MARCNCSFDDEETEHSTTCPAYAETRDKLGFRPPLTPAERAAIGMPIGMTPSDGSRPIARRYKAH